MDGEMNLKNFIYLFVLVGCFCSLSTLTKADLIPLPNDKEFSLELNSSNTRIDFFYELALSSSSVYYELNIQSIEKDSNVIVMLKDPSGKFSENSTASSVTSLTLQECPATSGVWILSVLLQGNLGDLKGTIRMKCDEPEIIDISNTIITRTKKHFFSNNVWQHVIFNGSEVPPFSNILITAAQITSKNLGGGQVFISNSLKCPQPNENNVFDDTMHFTFSPSDAEAKFWHVWVIGNPEKIINSGMEYLYKLEAEVYGNLLVDGQGIEQYVKSEGYSWFYILPPPENFDMSIFAYSKVGKFIEGIELYKGDTSDDSLVAEDNYDNGEIFKTGRHINYKVGSEKEKFYVKVLNDMEVTFEVILFNSISCDNVDCGTEGYCINGKCQCEKYWIGDNCNKLDTSSIKHLSDSQASLSETIKVNEMYMYFIEPPQTPSDLTLRLSGISGIGGSILLGYNHLAPSLSDFCPHDWYEAEINLCANILGSNGVYIGVFYDDIFQANPGVNEVNISVSVEYLTPVGPVISHSGSVTSSDSSKYEVCPILLSQPECLVNAQYVNISMLLTPCRGNYALSYHWENDDYAYNETGNVTGDYNYLNLVAKDVPSWGIITNLEIRALSGCPIQVNSADGPACFTLDVSLENELKPPVPLEGLIVEGNTLTLNPGPIPFQSAEYSIYHGLELNSEKDWENHVDEANLFTPCGCEWFGNKVVDWSPYNGGKVQFSIDEKGSDVKCSKYYVWGALIRDKNNLDNVIAFTPMIQQFACSGSPSSGFPPGAIVALVFGCLLAIGFGIYLFCRFSDRAIKYDDFGQRVSVTKGSYNAFEDL